jgi:Rrf2 family protein
MGENVAMKVSAKVDYAVQAIVEIARATERQEVISAEAISQGHDIPEKFLEGILTSLRKAKLINSYRGPSGGYELARPAGEINVAEIIRAIDGPLAAVRGAPPEEIQYESSVQHVADVWIATRVALREVLENITVAQIIEGKFDNLVTKKLEKKDARKRRKV